MTNAIPVPSVANYGLTTRKFSLAVVKKFYESSTKNKGAAPDVMYEWFKAESLAKGWTNVRKLKTSVELTFNHSLHYASH